MKEFSFRIPGPVVPQARPRASMVAGHIAMHDTQKCQSYKMDVAVCAQNEIDRLGLPVPVIPDEQGFEVIINISKGYLKSMSKKKKALAEAGKILPMAKPDLDNAAKGILDALKGVFWKDDAAVTRLCVSKEYNEMDWVDVTILWTEEETCTKSR